MRAIDADGLVKEIEAMLHSVGDAYGDEKSEIRDTWELALRCVRVMVLGAPTVEDGHQIVRCKECMHRKECENGMCYCGKEPGGGRYATLDNWFCGDAERRPMMPDEGKD